jgi:dihydroorotate dehydrogenase electron transfer subunit
LSDCLTEINHLRIVKIEEVIRESPSARTFAFNDECCSTAEPGQFIMMWIPGVDEVPMSLSAIDQHGLSAVTVAEVGDATKALHQKTSGDLLGIRGPFGNGFSPVKGKTMIVGGGTGLAPLMPLVKALAALDARITCLLGAKTKDELLFLDRIERTLSKVGGKIVTTTEDGSYGLAGVVTEPAEKMLAKERFDVIYTCGKEQMMYKVFLLAGRYNTPLQASLERIMRCGIGLCGSCVVGEFMVCKDGPVLSYDELLKIGDEFGKFKRDFSGRVTPV